MQVLLLKATWVCTEENEERRRETETETERYKKGIRRKGGGAGIDGIQS